MARSLLLCTCFITLHTSAQLVARMQVKDPIPGVCDNSNVYGLFSGFKGQEEPTCPLTKAQIAERLNKEVPFLAGDAKFKGEGMVGLIINCKGELVQCRMSNTTGNEELDRQIVAVFNSLGPWKVGRLQDQPVDASVLFSFKIKKGVLTLN